MKQIHIIVMYLMIGLDQGPEGTKIAPPLLWRTEIYVLTVKIKRQTFCFQNYNIANDSINDALLHHMDYILFYSEMVQIRDILLPRNLS